MFYSFQCASLASPGLNLFCSIFFSTIVNGIIVLISFICSDGFLLLIFYDFSIYKVLSSVNRDGLTFSFPIRMTFMC